MDSEPPQAADQRSNHNPSSNSSAEMPPSRRSANTTTTLMGKHRMNAAVVFLNQQIQIIQDEIDELDTIGGVSTVCPGMNMWIKMINAKERLIVGIAKRVELYLGS
ncbi:hypothetical protein CASFOL_041899 [Castilleja foliolosa]|uniref:Uncharacterized protein n=1 Tax=Castilleja foliolosa TaxID=1961234 RepID=A0ABD3BAC9_9LAMI